MHVHHSASVGLRLAVEARLTRPFHSGSVLRGVRQDVVRLFDRLYPEDKLEQLVFLLEMPLDMQPSLMLIPLAGRRAEVLRWAASPYGPGVDVLVAELRFLLETG